MKFSVIKNIFLVFAFIVYGKIQADETKTSTLTMPSEEVQTAVEKEALTWNQLLQNKYRLTNDQMKILTDSKLPDPQLAMVAQLAESSHKTIDEILKMRQEQKMGWGKIAKELGVAEKTLGQAVSSLKKERNEERKKIKKEKHQDSHAEMHEHHEDKHEMNHEMHKKERPERKEKQGRSGNKNK